MHQRAGDAAEAADAGTDADANAPSTAAASTSTSTSTSTAAAAASHANQRPAPAADPHPDAGADPDVRDRDVVPAGRRLLQRLLLHLLHSAGDPGDGGALSVRLLHLPPVDHPAHQHLGQSAAASATFLLIVVSNQKEM